MGGVGGGVGGSGVAPSGCCCGVNLQLGWSRLFVGHSRPSLELALTLGFAPRGECCRAEIQSRTPLPIQKAPLPTPRAPTPPPLQTLLICPRQLYPSRKCQPVNLSLALKHTAHICTHVCTWNCTLTWQRPKLLRLNIISRTLEAQSCVFMV